MRTVTLFALAVALVVGVVGAARAADETTLSGSMMCAKCTLKKADAKACQNVLVVKDEKGQAVGGRNMTFIDCIAGGNTVDREPLFVTAPAPAVDAGELRGDAKNGAGFFLDAQSKLTMIGCQAVNNHGKGIWLRGCGSANVQGVTVSGNSLCGIENEAPAALSAFAGNTARMNGAKHADNYIGLPTGTPVREWTLGAAPPNGTDNLINTSISSS